MVDFIEVNGLSADGSNSSRLIVQMNEIIMVGEVTPDNAEAYEALGIKGVPKCIIVLKRETDNPFGVTDTYDEIAEQLL